MTPRDPDLFEPELESPPAPPPPSRRRGPDTSKLAAAKLRPAVGTLRGRVIQFVLDAGPKGAIPDEAIEAFKMDARQTSIRPRFTELASAKFDHILVATSDRRRNRAGNLEIVYRHRIWA